MKNKKFKIIEKETLKETIQVLVEKKMRPATLQETWTLRKNQKVPMNCYDTGTVFHNGKFRTITQAELKNIEKAYEKDFCIICLGYDDNKDHAYLIGSVSKKYLHSFYGRMIGIKR